MEKRIIEIFIASDGKEFRDEKECLKHEENNALAIKFLTSLNEIRSYCNERSDCSVDCIFYDRERNRCSLYSYPQDWAIGEG